MEEKAGFLATKLIPDMFKNDLAVRNVFCPVLIIHGAKDQLVSVKHAKELYSLCPSQRKKIVIREEMEHNKFKVNTDLLPFLEDFFNRIFNQETLFYSHQ